MTMWTLIRFILIGIFGLLLMGCGGCDEGTQCPDLLCEEGQICAQGRCINPSVGCEEGCATGEFCIDGVCVSNPGQCSYALQACDPRRAGGNGFLCIDWGGADKAGAQCTRGCAESSCEPGSLCFLLSWGPPSACSSDAQCQAGQLCSSGGCYTAACRPSECAGPGEGDASCDAFYAGGAGFEDGAQCHDVGNEANYCFSAGTRREEQACLDFIDAYLANDLSQTCVSGLTCVDGTCRRGCREGSSCESGETCIGADVGSGSRGFCGPACSPFEVGSCGPERTCHPVSATQGYCRAAGSGEAFSPCEPGAGTCADGLTCVTYQQAAEGGSVEARCHPLCNVAAAPAGEDGRISAGAQAIRDESCPQTAPLPAYVNVLQLAQSVGAVDIYLNGELLHGEGATFEELLSPGAVGEHHGFGELPPGTHRIAVRPAGAPVTDAPLAESIFVAAGGDIWLWTLVPVVAGAFDEVTWLAIEISVGEDGHAGGLALIHAIPDLGEIDVFITPVGVELGETSPLRIASSLIFGGQPLFFEAPEAPFDMYVFESGEGELSEGRALLIYRDVASTLEQGLLALAGTMDPDDLNGTSRLPLFEVALPEMSRGESQVLSCIDSGNGVFGYCQQLCEGPQSYGVSTCEGASMGCAPLWRRGLFEWQHACVPVGAKAAGEPCDPRLAFGECDQGLYCLEYGNASTHYQETGQRGLCTSLCAEGDEGSEVLQCEAGQICGPWSFTESFDVGRCGYPCDPGRTYGDAAACPEGLSSCLPAVRLEDDENAPGLAPPQVVDLAPVCSASGTIAPGQGCAGFDCEAGSECIYPRSRQTDLVSTLLSPYFGVAGQRPVCTPQCDPFATGRSSHSCGANETCLFNYPWSADVGHCAPIVEEADILGSCARPGESCGPDAICAINGGQNVCFRFCQYEGGGAQGGYTQSSCPTGYQCAPFVQNIGYCIVP